MPRRLQRHPRLHRHSTAHRTYGCAEPWGVEEGDRKAVRDAGFSDCDIWDIAAVAGFFNMTNRVASATDMRPNSIYHGQARTPSTEQS